MAKKKERRQMQKGITDENLCLCPLMSTYDKPYYCQDHCKLLLKYEPDVTECAFESIADSLMRIGI